MAISLHNLREQRSSGKFSLVGWPVRLHTPTTTCTISEQDQGFSVRQGCCEDRPQEVPPHMTATQLVTPFTTNPQCFQNIQKMIKKSLIYFEVCLTGCTIQTHCSTSFLNIFFFHHTQMYEEQCSKLKCEHRDRLSTDLITNTIHSQQWPYIQQSAAKESGEVKWEGSLNEKKKQRGKRSTADKVDAQGAGEHRLSFSSSKTDNGSLTAHKGGKHTQTALFPFTERIYAMQPPQISKHSLFQGKTTLGRKWPT